MTGLVKHGTARFLGTLSVVIFTALVLDVLWGVVTRYVLGSQATWTEELARLLLVWLSMLGAALAYIDHSHLGVDLLTRALDPGARRVAAVVSHVLILFFAAAVMVYGGTALVIDRWQADQMLSALDIRKAWFYLSVPVSGVLIAIFAIDFAIGTWRGRLEPASEGAPGSVE